MELRGVKFGNYHTAKDWGMILNSKSITPPRPKTTYVTIEGRDGDLDYSEALAGEIKYENRTLKFTFLLTEGTYSERISLITSVLSILHGKKLDVVLDDDTSVYYSGRCSVTDVVNSNAYAILTVEVICDPFKLKFTDTRKTVTLSTSETTVRLTNNGAKTLIPTFTVSDEATVIYGSSSVTLDAGTHRVPKYILKTGNTDIRVKGTGTLTITYKEGYL